MDETLLVLNKFYLVDDVRHIYMGCRGALYSFKLAVPTGVESLLYPWEIPTRVKLGFSVAGGGSSGFPETSTISGGVPFQDGVPTATTVIDFKRLGLAS